MGELAGMFAIFCIFGIPMSIPLLNIWTRHQREMMQLRLRLQQGEGTGNVQADLHAIRQEVQALRETSMQYDLSFDAALQRLEQRVARTEQNPVYRPTYGTTETNGVTSLSNQQSGN